MQFNFVAGAIAAVALFIPVLLILAGQLFKNGSLLALCIYYTFTALYILTALEVVRLPQLFTQNAPAAFNYLDAPLMLMALLFFSNEAWKRRLVWIALALYIVFESVIGVLFGLGKKSSTYLLGPGTILVLSLTIFFFAHYGKISIVQGKSVGKTFMLVAILFLYGCYLMLYYLHYLQHSPDIADLFLIYYIGQFFSAVLMSIGLVWLIRRSREIKSLQQTRKELALFFDN